MDLSAEKLVQKALVQVVVSRSAVIALSTMGEGLKTIGHGFNVLGSGVSMMGNALFTVEADGARKYETLTGVRLGPAIGMPGRYTDLHPHGSGHPQTFPPQVSE
jgi:hypothetical protein